MSGLMPYCGAQHSSGFYCILKHGHEGDHLSLDNTKIWEGTPGKPVQWETKQSSNKAMQKTSAALHPTDVSYTEGESCSVCGSLSVIRESSCRKRCKSCGALDGGCG